MRMKNILLCILLATGAFHAAGTALAQDSRKTAVEIWNDAIEKAAKAGGFIKDYGESRVVHRGAKPEVILRGDQLTFNGQQLKIGQSIDAWIKVLPRERRCESGERSGSCVWDDLGLQAVLDFRNPGKVRAFYVFLRLPEMILDTTFQPSKPFPGYLELDGFGIDAQTAFWEVRKASDPKRNLRCGLRDCARPKGAFGKGVGLYFDLSTLDETGKVSALQLASY
jgi:hypothetical protein